ncbi:MAG: preprotein translocase subunit SecE [Lachnospiraceae bacterium]|nr:preprotein translocase subunit SecE [Lachnospiraceae bacterium]
MGDAAEKKTPAKSGFKSLKAEFKKIIWPDKQTLGKQTAAVVVITIVLGAFISLFDYLLKMGVNLIIG